MVELYALGAVAIAIAGALIVRLVRRAATLAKELERQRELLAQNTAGAGRDPITGLPTRKTFALRAEEVLDLAQAQGLMSAALVIDLDRFTAVNDTWGHHVGDHVLAVLAKRIRAAAGAQDLVARIGGDEFVVLQTAIAGRREAEQFAAQIMEQLCLPVLAAEAEIRVGGSIGVALHPANAADIHQLCRLADIAMQSARASGGNAVVFFEARMATTLERHASIESDLREAIENGEIEPHFQPIVELDRSTWIGFEALARWHHPRLGNVSPADFIAVAETSGLMVRLGEAILRRACEVAAGWPRPLMISVNVSAKQLREADFPDRVLKILAQAGLPAQRLELEITETALIEEFEVSRRALSKLKRHGVKVALDDFGTGYSSLSYLRAFPFDKLKIDRSFVDTLRHDANSLAIVEAVLGLGRVMGLQVTAEGIEDTANAAFLKAHGCTFGQGYAYGKAISASALDEALAAEATPARRELVAVATSGTNRAPQLDSDGDVGPAWASSCVRLIYTSCRANWVSDLEFNRILAAAVWNNSAQEISGALILQRGWFVQLLEGEADRVLPLFLTIAKDPRHSRVRLLTCANEDERLFSEWGMADLNGKGELAEAFRLHAPALLEEPWLLSATNATAVFQHVSRCLKYDASANDGASATAQSPTSEPGPPRADAA